MASVKWARKALGRCHAATLSNVYISVVGAGNIPMRWPAGCGFPEFDISMAAIDAEYRYSGLRAFGRCWLHSNHTDTFTM